MVAFRNLETRPILGRGPSILLRFVFFALLAFGLMWLDQRQKYLERVRYGFSIAAYPIQVMVNSPGAAWAWLDESFSARDRLAKENERLQVQLRQANLRSMRLEALEQENLRLRSMEAATTGIAERVMVAEIMRVDLNPLRHRVILSKGARDGVFKGQPVLDATGVFGQITRAGAFTSEAILISDFEGAVPVQVNRNGLRTIAIGTGDLTRLSLPFLPLSADIKQGDLLVTSGLGGVYPQGYPVATVIEVNKERAQTLAAIDARPAATLDRDREVLLVWVKQRSIDVDKEVPTSPPPASSAASPKPAAAAPKPAQATPTPTPPAQTAPAQGTPSTRPAQPRPRPEDRPAQPREEPPASQAEPSTEAPADQAPRPDEPPQQDEPEPVLPPSTPSEEPNQTKPPDPEPPPPEEDSP